jgi:uncharacterized DUF497 family protein
VVIDPDDIEWDDVNRAHATRHGVTVDEIHQALLNAPTLRRNRKGRAGDYYAFGAADGGRRIVVVVAWDRGRRVLRPITAWEQR